MSAGTTAADDRRLAVPGLGATDVRPPIWLAAFAVSSVLHAILIGDLVDGWRRSDPPQPQAAETRLTIAAGGVEFKPMTPATPADTVVPVTAASAPVTAVAPAAEPVQPVASVTAVSTPVRPTVPISPAAKPVAGSAAPISARPASSVAATAASFRPASPVAAASTSTPDVIAALHPASSGTAATALKPAAGSTVIATPPQGEAAASVHSVTAMSPVSPAEPENTPPAGATSAVSVAGVAPTSAAQAVSRVTAAAAAPQPDAGRPVAGSIATGARPAPVATAVRPSVGAVSNPETTTAATQLVPVQPPIVTALAPTTLVRPEVIRPAPGAAAPDAVPVAPVPEALTRAERMAQFVTDYDAGACTHLSPATATASASDDRYAAAVTAYGATIDPFLRFDQAFSTANGVEAAVTLQLIAPAQCPLLDALGVAGGTEVDGLITLDRTVVENGAAVAGKLLRAPLSATADEVMLVAHGAAGAPELYLVDDSGQVHDARPYIEAEDDMVGWRFSFPVTLTTEVDEAMVLLLSIRGRPAADQPAPFTVDDAARLPGLLTPAGTFTLAAFKVIR